MPRHWKRLRRSASANSTLSTSTREEHLSPAYEHDSLNGSGPISSSEPDAAMDPTLLDEAVIPEAEQPLAKTKASGSHAVGGGGYNSLKSFNGQYYSGIAVGGSHTWNYGGGVWHEVKTEPDLWKINYETKKRRARKAPERSGLPVGTGYHWLIVAHQVCSLSKVRTKR